MKRYKPIPIAAARDIAKRYAKQQVIIVAWDAEHGREHVTTYGTTKEACRQAAMGGDKIKKALGWASSTTKPPSIDPHDCLRCGGSGMLYRQDNASGPGTPDDGETCGGCSGTGRDFR